MIDVMSKQKMKSVLYYAKTRFEISKKNNLDDVEYWQKQVNELTDKLEKMK